MAKYYSQYKNFRTKPLYIFLFCLIAIIIPGICLWLFYGYINFSGHYLVFPAGGILAQGTQEQIRNKLEWITQQNYIDINIRAGALYWFHNPPKSGNANQEYTLYYVLPGTNTTSYYSPYLAAIIVPLFIWSIVSPFILKPAKIINYDTISFSFACAGLFCMLLLTAGIPVGKMTDSGPDYYGAWIILARIVICAVSLPVFFFISDRIVLLFLKLSKNPGQYYAELGEETLQVQKTQQKLRQEMAKKKTMRKEKDFIEIDSSRISYKNKKEGKK